MMSSPADFHGPVNVGNPNERTILELAELVIELAAVRHVRKPAPGRPARRLDLTLATERLGWAAEVPLEDGLRETTEYLSKLDMSLWEAPTPFWEAPPLEA